jgi:ribosome-associated translation inhibitor RaiA
MQKNQTGNPELTNTMIIQINTDNNTKATEEFSSHLKELISGDLDRFKEQISRVEVHLSDENAGKTSLNDKRCVMEARIEGRPPVAVTNQGDTHEAAILGAIDKMRSSLESITGKMKNRSNGGSKNHENEGSAE